MNTQLPKDWGGRSGGRGEWKKNEGLSLIFIKRATALWII